MAWVLRQFHVAGEGERPVTDAVKAAGAMLADRVIDGEYIVAFDVNAFGGIGYFTSSPDVAKAMRFPSLEAALQAWRTQSTLRPLRADGKPNRPLTALSISPIRIEDDA